MRCNRSCNNRINNFQHERALKFIYNGNVSLIKDLSKREQSVNVHHRNIGLLVTELCKTSDNISSHIMNELFEQRNILCNFDHKQILQQDQLALLTMV